MNGHTKENLMLKIQDTRENMGEHFSFSFCQVAKLEIIEQEDHKRKLYHIQTHKHSIWDVN